MKKHMKNKLVLSLALCSVVALAGCNAKLANSPADNNASTKTSQTTKTSQPAKASTSVDADKALIAKYEGILEAARNLNTEKKYADSNKTLNAMVATDLAKPALKAVKEAVTQLRAENTTGEKAVDDAKKAAKKAKAKKTASTKAATKATNTKQAVGYLSESQTNQFLVWASNQAAKGGMALSSAYFVHGAAGFGDWYANTVNGQMQVQNNDHPGPSAFPLHALYGVVFFYSNNGLTGHDTEMDGFGTADSYSHVDQNRPVHKYVLADDGQVYEWISQAGGGSISGTGEREDDGSEGDYGPDGTWIVSKDVAAQQEYQRIIAAG